MSSFHMCGSGDSEQGEAPGQPVRLCRLFTAEGQWAKGTTGEGGGAEIQPALCLPSHATCFRAACNQKSNHPTAHQHSEWFTRGQPVSCLRVGCLSSPICSAFLSLTVSLFPAVTPILNSQFLFSFLPAFSPYLEVEVMVEVVMVVEVMVEVDVVEVEVELLERKAHPAPREFSHSS